VADRFAPVERIAPWVLLGVGGYVLYHLLVKGKEYAEEGADWIARPIAYVISKFILPSTQHVAGGAVFQDGGYVSFDAIIAAGSKVDAKSQFTWKGTRYQLLQPRRDDGNYAAKRLT
jgi:hypothetical protein